MGPYPVSLGFSGKHFSLPHQAASVVQSSEHMTRHSGARATASVLSASTDNRTWRQQRLFYCNNIVSPLVCVMSHDRLWDYSSEVWIYPIKVTIVQ